jgi:hypothetical protein
MLCAYCRFYNEETNECQCNAPTKDGWPKIPDINKPECGDFEAFDCGEFTCGDCHYYEQQHLGINTNSKYGFCGNYRSRCFREQVHENEKACSVFNG